MASSTPTGTPGRQTCAFSDDPGVPFAPALSHEDVLRFATIAGAAACGLDDKIGTLTPGKQADIILVRFDDVNTFPVIDPIGTVVVSADTSNVDTVLVRGKVRKRGGRLVGVDLPPGDHKSSAPATTS